MASSASRSAPNNGRAWSEGHPLSVTSNQLIAGLVRKLGGFTFQELNLTLEDIKAMSQGGADLSYDFVTRPAYHHALVTGDAEFLRLMLALQKTYQIDPAGLIHALQNHDELTLELVHFWTRHKDDTFTFRGKTLKGSELREIIRAEMHSRLIGTAAPYNLKAANGVVLHDRHRDRRRPRHPRRRPAHRRSSGETSSAPTCCWRCTTPCSPASLPCPAGTSSVR